jgi:hypothetical protein
MPMRRSAAQVVLPTTFFAASRPLSTNRQAPGARHNPNQAGQSPLTEDELPPADARPHELRERADPDRLR